MAQEHKTAVSDRTHTRAYLVGGGVASLAAAAFMIKDGDISGKNIYIFEEQGRAGGSLDAQGDPDKGYNLRGGRMFEEAFNCTYELLSFIPSIGDPAKTAKQEILESRQDFGWNGKSRLIAAGEVVEPADFGFSARDRLDLTELFAVPEDIIGKKRISDWFKSDFFETNFWYMWATTFGFQPWHSAMEFKRYLRRFVHLFSAEDSASGIFRTQFNQYDSIVRPLVRWLAERGVHFELNCRVTDLDFKLSATVKTVEKIHLNRNGQAIEIRVAEGDLVFVTNGSMTSDSSYGSMDQAPELKLTRSGGSWALWEILSRKFADFGNPATFNGAIGQSKWESFTVTAKDSMFFDLMAKLSGHPADQGGLITIKDSNWLLTLVLNHQPHFYDQPKDIWVWWGYALYPDKTGNFVHKKMSECTGREILTEVLSHLRFMEEIPHILASSHCIPCLMPYITSQFMPREKGDRPLVVPKGSTNLAFVGQFCEVPNDVVFTVEYSVRSAQMAVYELLGLQKQPTPFYRSYHDVSVLFDAIKTLNRGGRKPQPAEKRL